MSARPLLVQQKTPLTERHVLGMAEMGYRGLSEQWLLRRAGDLHWRLIARAMGQTETLFTCAKGEPLYAAFRSTSLRMIRPEAPYLGGNLELSGELYRSAQGHLASRQTITLDGEIIGGLTLASTFVGRSADGSNRTIVRRSPKALAVPPDAPVPVQRIVDRAAATARRMLQDRHAWLEVNKGSEASKGEKILPCPATDFNAAGLLYFPSYSALSDRALFQAGETQTDFIAAREVSYVGNVEPGEIVTVTFKRTARGYVIGIFGVDDRPLAAMCIRTRAQS
ncbi:Pnap_2097 family protein [Agrobacterium sp. B1(2019)]|uniref:Pnap_2097 family protein n=1 Tax=Agrobacterium sp. B1(2019) TaxID=2607032 RepID=UPI001FF05A5C|nr:Pnap_2097 family protein [Agrobacterium sp. B1(2019)]